MSNYNDIHLIKSDLSAPITTTAELEELSQALRSEPRVAVDTEADSLYVYFEKVCLIQFSTPAMDYLVDPLALPNLSALAPLFADAAVEKIFHACEYDILCLKRDCQFVFNNIFDTMIAARILGWKNVGLGNILQERFEITLNKKLQRADWGHRPLTVEQLTYAREDTHYLIGLRDLQMMELERLNRLEEAREEFARLTRVEPNPRQFDPDAYWKIKGALALNPAALGILRELYRLRDAQARKENRPPFKVLTDAAMLLLSETAPRSRRDLARVRGISEYHISRFGETILEAVSLGHAHPQHAIPHPNSRRDTLLDNAARARLDRLKEWRKNRAAARGVEPDVIAPNDSLIALARHKPKDLEEIAQVTELGKWKTQEYGGEMLNVLNGKK
jgi:ribonuclease D